MNIRRRILTQSISLIGGDIEIDTTYAIYYTSTDGKVVTPHKSDMFGANIVSNTYENGKGIIVFDGQCPAWLRASPRLFLLGLGVKGRAGGSSPALPPLPLRGQSQH